MCGPLLRFCRGFWGKRVVERVFLMVNLWWDCGDFVVDGWSYFGVEKYATDSGFIFWGFPFWEWVGALSEPQAKESIVSYRRSSVLKRFLS